MTPELGPVRKLPASWCPRQSTWGITGWPAVWLVSRTHHVERFCKARGLTQEELGDFVGMSQRMIAYYEADDAQPPGAMLVDLAKTLRVTSDELLGLKPVKQKASPKSARLLKRLRQVEKLPAADQRAVLKFVDALVSSKKRRA